MRETALYSASRKIAGTPVGLQLAHVCVYLLIPVAIGFAVIPRAWAQQLRLTFQQQRQLIEAVQLHEQAMGLIAKGKDFDEACSRLEQSVRIKRNVLGNEHPQTAVTLSALGYAYVKVGNYGKARPVHEEALRITQKALGDTHSDTADSHANLGYMFQLMGEFPKARLHYQKALEIHTAALGEEHPSTLKSLNNMGFLLIAIGDYADARQYLEKAHTIKLKRLGTDNPSTITSFANVGHVLLKMGDPGAARPYYQQALDSSIRVMGEEHPMTASALNGMGFVCSNLGEYGEAREYYQKALRIRRQRLGDKHPEFLESLNNLASVTREAGDHNTARQYLEQILELRKSHYGEMHPDTALSYSMLGHTLCLMGDFSAAKPYCERALKIRKTILGNSHPDTATSKNNLGAVLRDLGDYEAAHTHFEEAYLIQSHSLGMTHHLNANVLHNLADLEVLREDWAAAARYTDRARRLVRRHISYTLPFLAEKEQLTFLAEKDKGEFHTALTLGLLHAGDTNLASHSAGWVLNGKAVAHDALAERAVLTQQSRNRKSADLVQRVLRVRRQLATISMSAKGSDRVDERQQRIDKLTAENERLTRELVELTGRSERAKDWVELESVRKAIADGQYLVEFVRLSPYEFGTKFPTNPWEPEHYGAWIIPPASRGHVQVVDLGEARPIERLIEEYHGLVGDTFSDDSTLRESGERAATAEVRALLNALSELLWAPLREHVADADTLILGPDASLWLVPFGALPGASEGRYLIEDMDIQYTVSGRDLVDRDYDSAQVNSPVIFANPKYDSEPDYVLESLNAIFGDNLPSHVDSSSMSSQKRLLPRAEPLPGTATEAEAIEPRLSDLTGSDPQSYLGRYALESVFKAVHHPRVVVLSTHGFFLPDQQTQVAVQRLGGGTRGVPLTADGKPVENPLLRCGLLFAGCNAPNAGAGTGDDGVLTGMEIVGVDLQGTELVVLSACETGLGEVRNGEGVAGLRQAFQLAGAQSVVASLWRVPDVESARLMNDFFTNLADGQTRSQALRNAQLKRIAVRREKFGAAHPYFWAAFTLTGR